MRSAFSPKKNPFQPAPLNIGARRSDSMAGPSSEVAGSSGNETPSRRTRASEWVGRKMPGWLKSTSKQTKTSNISAEPRSEERPGLPPKSLLRPPLNRPLSPKSPLKSGEGSTSVTSPLLHQDATQDDPGRMTTDINRMAYTSILASTNEPLPKLDGQPIELTAKQALAIIDMITAKPHGPDQRNPGWLRIKFAEAIKNNHGDDELCPQLKVAFLSQVSDIEPESDISIDKLEASILALWKSGFTYTSHPIVFYNKAILVTPSADELGKRIVNGYLENGLLTEADKEKEIIDIGTGLGYVPKWLRNSGFKKAFGLESDVKTWRFATQIKKLDVSGTGPIIEGTAAQYIKNNPDKKFPIVMVCNIYPGEGRNQEVEFNNYINFISDIKNLTEDNGKVLIGINSGDLDLTPGEPESLEEDLRKMFKNVEYIPASEFKSEYNENFSIGGQIGVYKCTNPIREEKN